MTEIGDNFNLSADSPSEVIEGVGAGKMAEAEQTALNTDVEFAYYKINTFTEKHVYKEIVPEVNRKLDEIRTVQDTLVMKWLTHKSRYEGHPGLKDLEDKVTELTEFVETNEMKVRRKVATFEVAGSQDEQKFVQASIQSIGGKSRKSCAAKRNEFCDQVDLLSVSCGLDLGNPETEIEKDAIKELYMDKEKDDSEISRLMRESKHWLQSLIALSKVYREYEDLAKESDKDAEELESNKTVFDTAKSRLLELKKIVEAEDCRRNLFTLDNTKFEKVKFPTFSGDKKEDYIKFKEKIVKAFNKNRVVLCDQLDKLRENLKGEALKHVPDTVVDLDTAWRYLHEAYGDPLRVLKERIKALDSIKALPPLKRKEARVTWFLEFESILEDVIQLGGDKPGKRSYCTAYSEFTVEKVLSALPDEGEDVSLRAKLSRVSGDGKDMFENMKAKVSEFRQEAQAFVGGAGNSKKPAGCGTVSNTSSKVFSQVSRLESCRICTLVDTDPNFKSTVKLFDNHIGNYPSHCPVFISFSTAKRKAVALNVGLCTQCLDPEVSFTRDHMAQCPVSKKDQFYTCKVTGCKSHLWLCTRHKDQATNKAAMEQTGKGLKSKHGLELCTHVEVMTCQPSLGSVDSAALLLQEAARSSGKELLPSPVGNPLFLFFAAKGKTKAVQTFVDSGSSDVLMKDGIPGNELPGYLIRKGPIHLKGVGGLTATATGEWLTCMERTDGRLQAMQVITMNKVTSEFPRISIHEAVTEIKQDKPTFRKLQNLRLPKEVGGGDTDCLLGIKLQDLYPEEVHSLPCGLKIFKSKLLSHDGKTNAMVGGPHSTFTALASQVGGHGVLLSMFVQGLAEWRSFGPLPLTYQQVDYKEELLACVSNLEDEDADFIEEVLKDDVSEGCGETVRGLVCYVCGQADDSLSDVELLESSNKLSILKKVVEIQGPVEVDYRCVNCRNCSQCKDADKV